MACFLQLHRLATTLEGQFVMEDWHNFGADYDKTLMAWHANFEKQLAAVAAQIWRSLLSHVEILSTLMRRIISCARTFNCGKLCFLKKE